MSCSALNGLANYFRFAVNVVTIFLLMPLDICVLDKPPPGRLTQKGD